MAASCRGRDLMTSHFSTLNLRMTGHIFRHFLGIYTSRFIHEHQFKAEWKLLTAPL